MEYLRKMLHIRAVEETTAAADALPNAFRRRYTLSAARLEGLPVFFLTPTTEPEPIGDLKKQIQRVQAVEMRPVVLVLETLTARRRQQLIDAAIPFVVPNKQCYLPFMGTILTERCDAQPIKSEALQPAAQLLILYIIERHVRTLSLRDGAQVLGVSAMTMTRAVRQAEALGLIGTHKDGVQKIITAEKTGKALFLAACPHFINPVKKVIYVENNATAACPCAGEEALSRVSMLNPPRMSCRAAAAWKDIGREEWTDERTQTALQIWRYDPRILAREDAVDALSLALSLKDSEDERVEEAVEEMLDEYWRENNG